MCWRPTCGASKRAAKRCARLAPNMCWSSYCSALALPMLLLLLHHITNAVGSAHDGSCGRTGTGRGRPKLRPAWAVLQQRVGAAIQRAAGAEDRRTPQNPLPARHHARLPGRRGPTLWDPRPRVVLLQWIHGEPRTGAPTRSIGALTPPAPQLAASLTCHGPPPCHAASQRRASFLLTQNKASWYQRIVKQLVSWGLAVVQVRSLCTSPTSQALRYLAETCSCARQSHSLCCHPAV